MATIIKKIRLINYKRFLYYTITPNEHINILVGDNEVGKSTVLEAIDLVTSGSIRKVEAIGLDRLLNSDAVKAFKSGERKICNLPHIKIELYLEGNFDFTMNGKNNSDGIPCDGIRMICAPNPDYYSEIADSLTENSDYFPFDFYTIRFSTFADQGYSGYRKKIRSLFIVSESLSSEYATNDFVKRMYSQYTEDNIKERALHKSKYRQLKNNFCLESLQSLNDRIPSSKGYSFGLKSCSVFGLENDLMIYENDIGIDNQGTGKQVFIKTDFALERAGDIVDVILIEEPENHLSHVNLRKLINIIVNTKKGQLFISTHNSLISTRLELKNLQIMHQCSSKNPISLKDLDDETAKYFMKAPVAGIIEYILSSKTILVEGPSEYMLFEKFYKSTANTSPENDGVSIIDIHGLSFKRYLSIAKILGNKVAVITDNDGDMQKNCVDKYTDFQNDTNIKIFYDEDEKIKTYEMVLYENNKELCNQLFGKDPLKYMLNNKTEAAFSLLNNDTNIVVPDYISNAIKWIRK
ncbi:MAG: AAA family ATPase [Christensenellaceae bacterium]|nr:AAA family ATPase [Christensenellaceae bacterium]